VRACVCVRVCVCSNKKQTPTIFKY
jgi:hypothetical protein